MSGCHCETDLNSLADHGREDLATEWRMTERGFVRGDFRDLYGQACSVQESSSAEHSAIWLGVGGCRMHLTEEQVRDLLDVLEAFSKDGDLRAYASQTR